MKRLLYGYLSQLRMPVRELRIGNLQAYHCKLINHHLSYRHTGQ